MSERHAYGTSCGCISRRLFILFSCLVLMGLAYAQLLRWLLESHLLDPHGHQEQEREPKNCTGTECFEVFSCYGMNQATFHIREPFITVGAALAMPLGVMGAIQGTRWQLQVAAAYFATNAFLRSGIIAGDYAYVRACDAYSLNVVDQILLQTKGLVRQGVQEEIAKMSSFSASRVDATTGGFHTLAFYLAFACAWLLFVAYLAREAYLLEQLLERGPLGLGMHYGIDQWDETFQYERYARARRMKEEALDSAFINDAQIPERKPLDLFPGFAVDYGATRGIVDSQAWR